MSRKIEKELLAQSVANNLREPHRTELLTDEEIKAINVIGMEDFPPLPEESQNSKSVRTNPVEGSLLKEVMIDLPQSLTAAMSTAKVTEASTGAPINDITELQLFFRNTGPTTCRVVRREGGGIPGLKTKPLLEETYVVVSLARM